MFFFLFFFGRGGRGVKFLVIDTNIVVLFLTLPQAAPWQVAIAWHFKDWPPRWLPRRAAGVSLAGAAVAAGWSWSRGDLPFRVYGLGFRVCCNRA